MREIFPGVRDLAEADLEALYAYPAPEKWLAVNFVSSADGAVTVEGRSASLSTPADRVIYRLGNDLADVVLVGAGTALIEGFQGLRPDEHSADRRRRHGLAPIPPIAVVTGGGSLRPDAPVITQALVPTIVITHAGTDPDLRAAWTAAGADVLVAGTDAVDLDAAVATLASRGLTRIDCEGGPRLFASLLAADAVDELRLTISPFLVAGHATRAAFGDTIDPARLRLASVLEDDGTLMLRYLLH
ncbi:pyrimidine reductase family protein [Amycolatopsis sp. CA-161197]|uniref:pyrimidine reductase family protein n=1 Tax=Amycolatopsis sp. CA-161197 TaxID=3239922 RepID=UPI003D8C046C